MKKILDGIFGTGDEATAKAEARLEKTCEMIGMKAALNDTGVNSRSEFADGDYVGGEGIQVETLHGESARIAWEDAQGNLAEERREFVTSRLLSKDTENLEIKQGAATEEGDAVRHVPVDPWRWSRQLR